MSHPRWGCRVSAPPIHAIFKKNRFYIHDFIKVLHDLQDSLNQTLALADGWYIGILKNIVKLRIYGCFHIVPIFPEK
jgi:hypothetical protein